MMNHIHTWNDYKNGRLCCSICGEYFNSYLVKEVSTTKTH